MCGIAGYSLSTDSSVDRTLAAQALLAGIAERGAHAVGYAYRAPGEGFTTVVKQRTPASHLLDRIDVPENAGQVLVHVRDYTRFTRLLKWSALGCLAIGFFVLLILK